MFEPHFQSPSMNLDPETLPLSFRTQKQSITPLFLYFWPSCYDALYGLVLRRNRMAALTDQEIDRNRCILMYDDETVADAVAALRDAQGAEWWHLVVDTG